MRTHMFHLHPALSTFPPVLLLIAGALELAALVGVAELRRTIRLLLWLAVPGVLAAFFSGYQASDSANQTFVIADQAIGAHHNLGRLLAFAIIPCAALEWVATSARHAKAFFEWLYRAVLMTCVGLVISTAYLGGELVFRHGAGVFAIMGTPQAPEAQK